MSSLSAQQLLAVAQQIDFDPHFRARVAADPLVALTAAGLDNATAMTLMAQAQTDEVELFGGGPALVAVRAHRWAMALLRQA
ncbi:MAG TPA: hypothetical protein VMM13_12995 [Euzebya sp.]|nr:hypothetical protein [Euzebya sp.]